jgi:hypothetical protein
MQPTRQARQEEQQARQEMIRQLFGFRPGANNTLQFFETLGWFGWIFGGFILGLWGMDQFPPVVDKVSIWILVFAVVFFFVYAKIPYFSKSDPPNLLPRWIRVMAWLGFAFSTAYGAFGLLLWSNGATDSTSHVHQVAWTKKHTSRHGTTVWIRSWDDPTVVYSISISRDQFEVLVPDSRIRLTTGSGTLGIPWVRDVRVISGTEQPGMIGE